MDNKKLQFFALICAIGLTACNSHEETSIDLGKNFIVLRLNGEVSIEDFSSTTHLRVPPDVFSIGNTAKYIVAYSMTNNITNIWVVNKDARIIDGPFEKSQYDAYANTNSDLKTIQQTNVWLFKEQVSPK
jgi:hypothetical protein